METHFFEIMVAIAVLMSVLQWLYAWLGMRRGLNFTTFLFVAFIWSIPIQFYWWGCGPCGQGILLIILLFPASLILSAVPMLSRSLAGWLLLNEKFSNNRDTPTKS